MQYKYNIILQKIVSTKEGRRSNMERLGCHREPTRSEKSCADFDCALIPSQSHLVGRM
jgi:hypothetical protein